MFPRGNTLLTLDLEDFALYTRRKENSMPRTRQEPVQVTPATKSTLPGEKNEDKKLVDEVTEHVNQLYVVKGLETAREIGEYLLRRFFDGDPSKFHERGRKHVSFRKLAEREDLQPSYSFLWNACAVVEQLRLLPVDLREALPFSHHKLLLPVKDEATKVKLAQRAVEKGLSKRALEAEIHKARKRETSKPRSGRRPLPVFVKALTRLAGVVKMATSDEVTPSAFAVYSPEKAHSLLGELDKQIISLQALRGQVERALGEWAQTPHGE